jgi:hypothetical protein
MSGTSSAMETLNTIRASRLSAKNPSWLKTTIPVVAATASSGRMES